MLIKKIVNIFILLFFQLFSLNTDSFARNNLSKVSPTPVIYEQTVYVPVYASIYHGDNVAEFELTATLSIRNTNIRNPISLNIVDYYDTRGKLIKKFLNIKRKINPLETVNFIIKESDLHGGTGANFIVRWSSAKKVNPPLIEAVMIGTKGQQGISFTSRGTVINQEN